jgi:hypothetical protein
MIRLTNSQIVSIVIVVSTILAALQSSLTAGRIDWQKFEYALIALALSACRSWLSANSGKKDGTL